MEEFLEGLRTFDPGVPDPSEIIEDRNPFANRKHTEESKKKMSISAKKRPPVSEETRRKNAKFGEANGFYGKTHSEESKKKMSAAKKGNKNCLGVKKTPEQIEKWRQKMLGRKHSEAHIEKRRKQIKGRKWWNDGQTTKMSIECPGKGWILGRNLNTKEESKD